MGGVKWALGATADVAVTSEMGRGVVPVTRSAGSRLGGGVVPTVGCEVVVCDVNATRGDRVGSGNLVIVVSIKAGLCLKCGSVAFLLLSTEILPRRWRGYTPLTFSTLRYLRVVFSGFVSWVGGRSLICVSVNVFRSSNTRNREVSK